jgi:hypothetical protein
MPASLIKAQFDLGVVLTDVYTCPARKTETITLYLCNRAGATTFRVAIGIDGEADNPKQYIYYDSVLPANDSLKETFTLNEGDVLRVKAGVAQISASVFLDQSYKLANASS